MLKNIKKLQNPKILKLRNLEKYGSFSEFRTSTEKSVVLATRNSTVSELSLFCSEISLKKRRWSPGNPYVRLLKCKSPVYAPPGSLHALARVKNPLKHAHLSGDESPSAQFSQSCY